MLAQEKVVQAHVILRRPRPEIPQRFLPLQVSDGILGNAVPHDHLSLSTGCFDIPLSRSPSSGSKISRLRPPGPPEVELPIREQERISPFRKGYTARGRSCAPHLKAQGTRGLHSPRSPYLGQRLIGEVPRKEQTPDSQCPRFRRSMRRFRFHPLYRLHCTQPRALRQTLPRL